MTTVRQVNFSGGEIAPELWGRSDVERYAASLRRCENFIPTRYGQLVNRPGTRLVSLTKSATHYTKDISGTSVTGSIAGGTQHASRLFPFIYSDAQTYVLEAGPYYFRFSTGGAPLMVDTVWDGSLTYGADDYVAFSGGLYRSLQANNLNKQPNTNPTWWASQAWNSATTYTAGSYVLFGGSVYYTPFSANLNRQPDTNPSWWSKQGEFEVPTPYAEADLARLKFAQVGDVVVFTHPSYVPYELSRLGNTNWTMLPVSLDARSVGSYGVADPALLEPLPVASGTDYSKEWQYRVTTIQRDAQGRTWETEPFMVTHSYVAGAFPQTLHTVPSTLVVGKNKPITINCNRGSLGLTLGDTVTIGWRIYRGRGGLFGLVGDTKDGTFIDDVDLPDYSQPPPQGRNPFKVFNNSGTLVRTENPTAVAYYQLRRMFGGTSYRPGWVFGSRTNDFANFDSHLAGLETTGGPLVLADDPFEYELACLKREEIRSLLASEKLLVFTSQSVWAVSGAEGDAIGPASFLAQVQSAVGASWLTPLLVNESPLYVTSRANSVRELVYDDGHRTYVGTELSAFAGHLFRGRTLVDWAHAALPFGLVWAVRDDGALLSLTYAREFGVWAWAKHTTAVGTFSAVVSVPEGDEDAVYLVATRSQGVRTIERMCSRITSGQTPEAFATDGAGIFLDAAVVAGDDIPSMTLPHLKGATVYAVGSDDTQVRGPFTVNASTGVVSFGMTIPGYVACGLAYTSTAEVLDVTLPKMETKTRQARVAHAHFELSGTRDVEVGETYDTETGPDYVPTPTTAKTLPGNLQTVHPTTPQIVRVNITGRWGLGARVYLKHTQPLPCEVLGVSREVDFGGI